MGATTKKLRIRGEVQGVWYRAWSAEAARVERIEVEDTTEQAPAGFEKRPTGL